MTLTGGDAAGAWALADAPSAPAATSKASDASACRADLVLPTLGRVWRWLALRVVDSDMRISLQTNTLAAG
jgi:hypothetical protein